MYHSTSVVLLSLACQAFLAMYFVAANRFPFSRETHLVLITAKFPALISKKKPVCLTFLQRIPHFE